MSHKQAEQKPGLASLLCLRRWPKGKWIVCLLGLVVCLGRAQQVTLELTSPPKQVLPGEVVTHVFRVLNQGETALSLEFRVHHPPGWSLLTPLIPEELLPGEEVWLFLTLAVPRGAEAGEYEVLLEVNWPAGSSSAAGEVWVLEVRGIELLAPEDGEGLPGGQVVYRFAVINRGNVVDSFSLEARSARGWPLSVSPRGLTLAPGERAEVTVRLTIPQDPHLERDLLEVSVASTFDPQVSDTAAVFTRVLPPTPELIVGSPYAELAATLGAGLSGDLWAGAGDSHFSLQALGQVLEGAFSLDLRLNGPVGTPFRLSTMSLGYHRAPVRAKLGNVSLTLTPLLRAGTWGVEAELEMSLLSLSLLSGWEGEEGQAGGKLVLSHEGWQWGLAYLETRGGGHAGAVAAWTEVPLAAGLGVHLEGGLGYEEPFTDRAGLCRLVAHAPPLLLLSWDLFTVGPHYPSLRRDQEGIGVSGRIWAAPLTFRFSVEHWRDNVWRDPLRPVVGRSFLNLHFDWSPEEWPVGFWSGLAADRARETGPSPAVDSRTRRLEVGMRGDAETFSFSLLGRWQESLDFTGPAGTHSLQFEQRFLLDWEPLTGRLELRQEALYDLSWALVERDESVSFSLQSTGSPHRISLRWLHRRAGGEVQCTLSFQATPELSFTGGASWGWGPGGRPTGLSLEGGFEYRFPWQVPFLPAKGWLMGEVFVDLDGDGLRDPREEGVAGAVLETAGVRVSTNQAGEFKFPPLEPGEYALALVRLPLGLRPLVPSPQTVSVQLARETWVLCPVESRGRILGVVFEDADQDGERDPEEFGLAEVEVALYRAEELVASTLTDPQGEFSFWDLPAGDYRLRLGRLPGRYQATTPEEIHLSLAPGAEGEVAFGAWEPPREVVITFQPPLADFSWSPELPVVGQSVTFDGTLSVDFDGEVVAWEWDFTGDGVADATGPQVTWTFSQPGTYLVTLTVTDNEGHQGSWEMEVEVSPAG